MASSRINSLIPEPRASASMPGAGPGMGPPVTSKVKETEKQLFEALKSTITETKNHLVQLHRSFPKQPLASPPPLPDGLLPSLDTLARKAEAFGILVAKTKPGGSKGEAGPGGGGGEKSRGKKRTMFDREEGDEERDGPAAERERRKDWIDAEGVHLWNQCSQLKQSATWPSISSSEKKGKKEWSKMMAGLRLASFRLMEASSDSKPNARIMLQLLRSASKAAVELFQSDQEEAAQALIIKAAQYELALRNVRSDGSAGFDKDKRGAVLDYYLARVDMAVREDNEATALGMIQKCIGTAGVESLDPTEMMQLATKCYEVGAQLTPEKAVLDALEAPVPGADEDMDHEESASVVWLRKAAMILEHLEQKGMEGIVGAKELKIAVLSSLARALLMDKAHGSRHTRDAEIILADLLKDPDLKGAEDTQRIRFMQLMVYRLKASSTTTMLEVLREIIDHTIFDDTTVQRLMSEIAHLGATRPDLQIPAMQHLLKTSLMSTGDNRQMYSSKILIGFVILCQTRVTKEPDTVTRAMEEALDAFVEPNKEIPQINTTSAVACITVLWKMGEAVARLPSSPTSKKQAAGLVLLAAHRALSVVPKAEADKVYRRAASFYLQAQDYAQAEQQLSKAGQEQAHTQLLIILCALSQESKARAISAVEALALCQDVTAAHLQLVLNRAHDVADPDLTIASLNALDQKLDDKTFGMSQTEGLRIIRCILRLEMKHLESQDPVSVGAISRVLEKYRKGLDRAREIATSSSITVQDKELAWFYKSAYNLAVKALGSWNDGELIVSAIEVALDWMGFYKQLQKADTDPKLESQIILALHAASCATIFVARGCSVEAEKARHYQEAIGRVNACRKALGSGSPPGLEDRLEEIRECQLLFLVEAHLFRKDWIGLDRVIDDLKTEDTTAALWEAAANAIVQDACPLGLQHKLLSSTVAALNAQKPPPAKICRWSRAVIEFLLHRRGAEDIAEALKHGKQAQAALEQLRDTYPQDEVDWMKATAWNMGLERSGLGDHATAREWLEVSLGFAKFSQTSDAQKEQMYTHYTRLLARAETQDVL